MLSKAEAIEKLELAMGEVEIVVTPALSDMIVRLSDYIKQTHIRREKNNIERAAMPPQKILNKCKFMRDTGVMHRPCCGNYIVCDNPESPIFEDCQKAKERGEVPHFWWAKKCSPDRCRFFEMKEENAD